MTKRFYDWTTCDNATSPHVKVELFENDESEPTACIATIHASGSLSLSRAECMAIDFADLLNKSPTWRSGKLS